MSQWALKADIRLWLSGFLLNEQTWLQHLKENAWLMDYLKPFSCCDWYYKAVSADIETGKSSHQRIYSSPLGKLWNASTRRSLECCLIIRIRLTTDTAVVEKHLQLKLSYFLLHGDYGLFLFRALYLGRLLVLRSHELDKGSSWMKGRGCRQFESYLQATKKLVWVLMDVLVIRCDETPWPCH